MIMMKVMIVMKVIIVMIKKTEIAFRTLTAKMIKVNLPILMLNNRHNCSKILDIKVIKL